MGNTLELNLTWHKDIFNYNVFENVACNISAKTTIWYSVIHSIIHQRWRGNSIVCYQSTCTWLVLDWKTTSCTWCLPSTLNTWTCTCTCKYENVLVLDSSTSKSTWPQPCLWPSLVMVDWVVLEILWNFRTNRQTNLQSNRQTWPTNILAKMVILASNKYGADENRNTDN